MVAMTMACRRVPIANTLPGCCADVRSASQMEEPAREVSRRARTQRPMQRTTFLFAVALMVPLELAACGSSEDAPGGAAPLADGGVASGDASAGGNSQGAGVLCDGATPVAKPIKDATGSIEATLVNDGANLDPAFGGGTMPCTAYFEPSSGVNLGGGKTSGAFGIICRILKNDRVFELTLLDGMGKPTAGTYRIGVASIVPGDGGTPTWNGEMTVRLLEMPACAEEPGAKKVWGSSPGGTGTLVIDSITGNDVRFHITSTPLTTFTLAGEENLSQGALQLSGSGAGAMSGL